MSLNIVYNKKNQLKFPKGTLNFFDENIMIFVNY